MKAFEYKIFFSDTDYGRVVYFSNYLRFAEQAKYELFLSLGIDEAQLDKIEQTGFMVKDATVNFKSPLTLGDTASVLVDIITLKSASAQIVCTIKNKANETDAAIVTLQMVCVDSREFKPKRFPSWVIDKLKSHKENA